MDNNDFLQRDEANRLDAFAEAVRESTLKRLRAVPPGLENWAPNKHAMTIADIAEHLIQCDSWLFRLLEENPLEPLHGKRGMVIIERRSEYIGILDGLKKTGMQRRDFLLGVDQQAWKKPIHDLRFPGNSSVW